MFRRLLFIAAAAVFTTSAFAQTARVQIIHNAADPAASVVDIYVNGGLALDDFAFRDATPFIDLPAGQQITVGVAPGNSSSAADAIANFPFNLTPDETYLVVANGVLNPAAFAPNPDGEAIGFGLWALDGQETSNSHTWQIRPVHGVTDAPAVDIRTELGTTVMGGRKYGQETQYIAVDQTATKLTVFPASSQTGLAAFSVDLSGPEGEARVLLASGFLDSAANGNGPAFGLLLVAPDGTSELLPAAPLEDPTARVQIVHNAADPAASEVDIYIGSDLALDNFAFRAATPYIDLPAGSEIVIGVAPATSSSSADAIATFPVTLTEGETYTVIANGVLSPGDFAANPDGRSTGFTLWVRPESREAASDSAVVEFLVVHGATDAPGVDVAARGVATLVPDAKYGDITDYIAVPAAPYVIDILAAGTETVVASFDADLSGLTGGAGSVLASGFLNPAANGGGEAFGLLLVLPDGSTSLLPAATMEDPTARVQIVHNAADPAASEVDIYIGSDLALDNFAFRAATPYIDLPAGSEIVIGVAPATSSSSADAIATFPVTLTEGETYTVIANGVLSPGDFAANPDGRSTGFTLWVRPESREAASDDSAVEFLVVHGATDAPGVDVAARGVATLVPDAKYGDITDYIAVPAAPYVIDILAAGTETVVASFDADLSGLTGGAGSVLASGFLNPAANGGGEAFGLLLVLPDGTTAMLPVASGGDPSARVQIMHNSADPAAALVDIYVDGGLALDDFAFGDITPFIDLPAETEVSIAVAPSTSSSVSEAIATFPVTLDDGEIYTVIASGVLDTGSFASNPDGRSTAFNLWIRDESREEAQDPGLVEFVIVHGATDAPAVDIEARGVATLATGASYGDATDYIAVPPAVYTIDVKAAGTDVIVASFSADLTGMEGMAATVIARGFLDPSANGGVNAFGLLLAAADGSSGQPAVVTSNETDLPVESFELSGNYPNPFAGRTNVAVTMPAAGVVNVNVYSVTGVLVSRVSDVWVDAGAGQSVPLDLQGLAAGTYVYEVEARIGSRELRDTSTLVVLR